jgi:hypothetical protein
MKAFFVFAGQHLEKTAHHSIDTRQSQHRMQVHQGAHRPTANLL